MRLGSFCTGYGGLDMAVEAHYGADLAWYSEVDKDCNNLLATRFPGVPNLGDLTTIDWGQVEPVDIMCAGFPCQPFSHAGKREGENDERAIFAYIADAIGVLRPGIVVLENVAGLLTLGGPGVVGTLTGLGYDLRWGLVRASDTGAPHRRARWFCIATDTSGEGLQGRRGEYGLREDRSEVETGRGGTPPTDADISGGEARGDAGHSRQRVRLQPVGSSPPPTDTDGEGFPRSGAARRVHDSGEMPVGSRPRVRASAPCGSTSTDTHERGIKGVRPERGLGEATLEPCDTHRFGPYGEAVDRWGRILGRPAPDPTDDRGLRPGFVEWMMGLPEGHVCALGMSRTAELKMLGNGVCPQQAALALRLLDER